jgi:hypothetical protein
VRRRRALARRLQRRRGTARDELRGTERASARARAARRERRCVMASFFGGFKVEKIKPALKMSVDRINLLKNKNSFG